MKGGAARDFDALFASYYRRLARLLYRFTADTAVAEAIASEAFWRLHQKPPTSASNIEGWLYRTGVRLAFDHMKMDRRRLHYETLSPSKGAHDRPDELLEQQQRQQQVRTGLAALKPEQAAMIVLRGDGASYTELAEILELNPASVGTMLSRAVEAFRKEYVKRYGEFTE